MYSLAVIIPAAGSGTRLETDTPKPYLEVRGVSVLEYTINKFLHVDQLRQLLIPTGSEWLDETRNLLDGMGKKSSIETVVTAGGEKRQDSIYNAMQSMADVDLVAVHDAVRPFVTVEQIEQCCDVAYDKGGAVLGIPARDTIKQVDSGQKVVETPSRESMWQAQTPQVFHADLLRQAYEQALDDNFTGTDDASLVERTGKTVYMVRGSYDNFKITYPIDWEIAKLRLQNDSGI